MTGRSARLARTGLVVLALGVLTPVVGTPAAARPARAPTATVTLSGQPAWSYQGDDVALRIDLRAPTTAGLEILTIVHSAVSSRIAFERTVSGEKLGGVITTRSTPVADLPIVGTDRVVTLPLQDPDAPRDPARIRLSVPGTAAVFPVEIELRDATSATVASRFVTELVVVRRPAPGASPNVRLRVVWLWRLVAPPALATNGGPAPDFAAALAPAGRLGRITAALENAGGVPVTLVPNPETADAAASSPGVPGATTFVTRLRSAVATSTVLASPFTTVEGPSLARSNLDQVFADQITTGRSTLERVLDAAVDRTIAAPQPLDGPSLVRLRADGGTSRLIVDPGALTDAAPADQFTPARPFRLDTPAGSFDAVEVNRTTSDLLTRRGTDALRAQQVLAGLTVIALEQPNRTRGVVMDTPLQWDGAPKRMDAVLAGLRDNPVLVGAGPADLFDSIPAATSGGKPYTRTLAPRPASPAPVTRAEWNEAEQQVRGLASMIGADDPLVARLRHQLRLTPASRMPDTGRTPTVERLQSIHEQIGAITSGVVAPQSRTFRLTSRTASVPLSIENTTNRPLSVRVRLRSQKLDFPNGSDRIVAVPPGNNQTTSFDVEARASGTFQVLMSVTSPDDRIAIQRTRYTVRSSAVSGVGIFLTVGAALFLAAWWVLHWRRDRRARVAEPTA